MAKKKKPTPLKIEDILRTVEARQQELLKIHKWAKDTKNTFLDREETEETLKAVGAMFLFTLENPLLPILLTPKRKEMMAMLDLACLYGYYTGYQDRQLEEIIK